MKTVFSLREDDVGRWNVCRGAITLFSELRLSEAIKVARETARDEHVRSGRPVTVEMPGPPSKIVLANFEDVSVAA